MKKSNIKFKSLLHGVRSIEKRNQIFKGLSNEGKRLEIAWDMLKLLMEERIKPSYGFYWSVKLHELQANCDSSEEFHKKLNQKSKITNCSVCARGGIMLSQIRLGNSIHPHVHHADKGYSSILDGFSMDSMQCMENEYESLLYNHPYKTHTKEKLMNIVCNVLVNGDFNIEDKTDYLID